MNPALLSSQVYCPLSVRLVSDVVFEYFFESALFSLPAPSLSPSLPLSSPPTTSLSEDTALDELAGDIVGLESLESPGVRGRHGHLSQTHTNTHIHNTHSPHVQSHHYSPLCLVSYGVDRWGR